MIFITQLIYINEGQEKVFDEFEALAIPVISQYCGELLFRIRPDTTSFIQSGSIDRPYEIHLVSFKTESDFECYMADEQRKAFLHLKEKSIRVSILIKGTKIQVEKLKTCNIT